MTGAEPCPGPLDRITDVAGIRVGQAEDSAALTGTTVILPPAGTVGAVDRRGGGPGTRETDALAPETVTREVHALVLSGGSAFGLDAAGAVAARLAADGIGFAVAGKRVPIVPSAILFDLAVGAKDWGADPPYRALGMAALADARTAPGAFALGNAGAGLGATTAGLKGGLGSASLTDPQTGVTVGVIVAVNAAGSVTMGDGCFWAWPFERDGEFGGRRPDPGHRESLSPRFKWNTAAGANTTIAAVACDATLDKAQALRLAVMAQDGLARAIRPVHTPLDGDTVFALATGAKPEPDIFQLARIGALAADCLARAVAKGIYAASSIPGFPSWREKWGAD